MTTTMTMTEHKTPPRAWTTPAQPDAAKQEDGPTEFSGSIKVSQKPPRRSDLERVAGLPVLNAAGVSIPFRNLYTSSEKPRRVVVIFIRHFFCGNCQEYLRTLCRSVSPQDLLALPTPTEIAVVGCGQPELIDFYTEATACTFPIYADPTKRLYDELGMTRTLNLGHHTPDYMQKPLLRAMLASVYQGLSQGTKAFRGGDYYQVGGEFLFEQDEVTWCHRMTNTRDHAEVPELRGVLGLDEKRAPLKKRWSLSNGGGAVRRSLSLRRPSWRKRSGSGSRSRSGERRREEHHGGGGGGGDDTIREEEERENLVGLPSAVSERS